MLVRHTSTRWRASPARDASAHEHTFSGQLHVSPSLLIPGTQTLSRSPTILRFNWHVQLPVVERPCFVRTRDVKNNYPQVQLCRMPNNCRCNEHPNRQRPNVVNLNRRRTDTFLCWNGKREKREVRVAHLLSKFPFMAMFCCCPFLFPFFLSLPVHVRIPGPRAFSYPHLAFSVFMLLFSSFFVLSFSHHLFLPFTLVLWFSLSLFLLLQSYLLLFLYMIFLIVFSFCHDTFLSHCFVFSEFHDSGCGLPPFYSVFPLPYSLLSPRSARTSLSQHQCALVSSYLFGSLQFVVLFQSAFSLFWFLCFCLSLSLLLIVSMAVSVPVFLRTWKSHTGAGTLP